MVQQLRQVDKKAVPLTESQAATQPSLNRPWRWDRAERDVVVTYRTLKAILDDIRHRNSYYRAFLVRHRDPR